MVHGASWCRLLVRQNLLVYNVGASKFAGVNKWFMKAEWCKLIVHKSFLVYNIGASKLAGAHFGS